MRILGKILAVGLVGVLAGVGVVGAQVGEVFRDVGMDSDYYLATTYLGKSGVVDGYGDGLFRPGKSINRAELLKILVEAEVGEVFGERELPFEDVRKGDWYAKYVGYAYEVGWVDGYPDGSFRPGRKVSRAEAVTLIGKIAGWSVDEAGGDREVFADVGDGDWFESYVNYGLRGGLIGDKHGYFWPHAEVSRGEMANLVYKNFFEGNGSVALVSYREGFLKERNVLIDMPFTAQAPFGEWDDPRQNDGCEEASALMAVSWARRENWSLEEAKDEIIAISEFEKANFPTFVDTSVEDTLNWIVKGYFDFQNVELIEDVTAEDIKQELFRGNLVIVAANGRILKNRYYTAPGPLQHMLVIKGYDAESDEFITNDPGTRRGEGYRGKCNGGGAL